MNLHAGASEICFPHGVLQITPSRSMSSHVQSVLRLGPSSGALLAQIVAPGSTKASMRPGLMQWAFTSPFDSSLTSMPSKTKCAVKRSVRLTKLPFVSGPSKGTTTGFVSGMAFAAAASQRNAWRASVPAASIGVEARTGRRVPEKMVLAPVRPPAPL